MELLEKYKEALEYCELNSSVPFYSESFLPAPKEEIRAAIEAQFGRNHELFAKTKKFINDEIASKLNQDGLQVELKRQGLKHDELAVRRYWKTLHGLYGVDERLVQ